MRVRTLIAVGFLICSLQAQSKLEALAAQLQADAAREELRLGLDTRIRAAERLRVVNPTVAKRILDSGLPLLSKPVGANYLAYRFMISYAFVDLDAAERATSSIADKASAYTALIERSVEVKDYARASRMVASADREGQYALGAVTLALQKMKLELPIEAAKLLLRRVAAFPAARANDREVRTLLNNLAVFPEINAELAREALRKIFEVIDRPAFRNNDSAEEWTATYIVHGKEIQTGTTYETTLLPSAAYLAVFDPEAFAARAARLPEWRSNLQGLYPAELPGIVRAHFVVHQKNINSQVSRDGKPAVELSDYSKMSYQDALAAARKLDPLHRCWVLQSLAKRPDLTSEQRRQNFEEIWTAARELPLWERFNSMRQAFWEAAESRIDGIFSRAVLAWIETLDAAVKSNDTMLLRAHENGEFHNAYSQLEELFEQRDYNLPQPHPSIMSRRDLRSLDRAAYDGIDFSLLSLDGKRFQLSELKGKVVMIDFWATWCPPCRDALPSIEKIQQRWRDRGLMVLGISDEPSYVIQSFLAKNQMTYPMLLDPDRRIHNLFGQDGNGQGIPLTVVFDRDGNFVGRVPYPHNEENFLAVLKKAGLLSM